MIIYCCVDCRLHVSVLYLYYASEIKQETKIEIYKAIRVIHSCAYLYYKGGGGGTIAVFEIFHDHTTVIKHSL